MRQQRSDARPEVSALHRGMVPVSRSRSRDALFEVGTILSNLERRQVRVAEVESLRALVRQLEDAFSGTPLEVALERAEALRAQAADLYARATRD